MRILQGINELFNDEKRRGMATSVVNGSTISALNYYGVMVLGLSAPVSTLIFMYIIGSVSGYTLDILFAKTYFKTTDGKVATLPYSALHARAAWLLRSFAKAPFFKFLVASIIETITGIALIRAAIAEAERQEFMTDRPRWRNLGIALVTAVLVFLLFGNILRFDWAYSSNPDNPHMNITVLMWMALSILAFALVYLTLDKLDGIQAAVGRPPEAAPRADENVDETLFPPL